MCGIFFVHSKKDILNKNRCDKIKKTLYNRGPDFLKYNYFFDDKVFLLNSILSITGKNNNIKDLIKSQNKNFIISFNGQIYNYKDFIKNDFNLDQSASDTEVLINLYQQSPNNSDFLDSLKGMFACIILDIKKKEIIIFNDPQGEKNLYYYNDESFFIVSSTIESILEFLGEYKINYEELKNYFFTRHFMPLNNTCFNKIKLFQNSTLAKYSVEKKSLEQKIYDDPLTWVSEKKYNFFTKFSNDEMTDYLHYELKNEIKHMIPESDYGCIVSGGIDSSLQAAIISSIKKSKINLIAHHKDKDISIKNIKKFNNFLSTSISIIKVNKNLYLKKALLAYKIISSPLQTHDLVGRMIIAENFRKKKCKVFFSADGCDELLGGQQLYLKVFKKNLNLRKNISPYSSIINMGIQFKEFNIDNYSYKLNAMWKSVNERYSFLDLRSKNIQSSLFLDYFVQSTNVANRSNDLISCNYSVESRNVFIQKKILKILINLPLKYKIDFKSKDPHFIQKPILKNIFLKYYSSDLIFPKKGFPGYPNQLRKIKGISKYPLINKFLGVMLSSKKDELYYDKNRHQRDLEWKKINTEIFLNQFI